ncbi:gluconate 2-dehydrogenase subunit 3 family protein [Pedobacter deserti]|uniref:gluconate 2-dehydrogenase subunit 3 family protein n=1 Tax=Pedobacter deserti TaxID=2817382 RepID=UPI002109C048|nr:gluconate 2-dehydrogenase subunit 3 family protein [Pedobacter sp. SYSU D00382]
MNRRLAIKQIMIFGGGLALLPSGLRAAGKASVWLNHVRMDAAEEKLLGEIAEIIIPKTTTPGAKDLGLHLFVMKMVDDCYKPQDQKRFMSGLAAFKGLDPTALKEMVVQVNAGKAESDDIKAFFRIMKQQTINGYLNSKYVMTNLVKWELVPARYNGYFPVKS